MDQKTITIRIIHEIVNIIKITSVLQKSIQSSVVYYTVAMNELLCLKNAGD